MCFSKRFVMPPTAAFKIRSFSLPVFVCLSPTHRHIHSSLRFWSMCTGCKSHWIKVIVVVVHSVVSWKQLKCHGERVQADCPGREKCNVTATIWAVVSPRRFFFFLFMRRQEAAGEEGRRETDRTETSRVNWSKAIRGWGAAVHYFSATPSEVLSFQTVLVNKTLILLLQLLLRAKKTNYYVLPAHSSLSNPATMDAPPDTISNITNTEALFFQMTITLFVSVGKFIYNLYFTPWEPVTRLRMHLPWNI